ncbi:protein tyrosine/serine phosphatase [Actinomycetospora succinea]|uniref:Protein tyrosine/serine phosphatase n=1 Tax=Actinomycetospora succinea TaxID=663603 RepID=A0A4R6VIV9_9PSEU|nr:tyrosine-protein phosphatase [Actinomycetospora succinea]TDQ63064.1 protein tyrosine/serine phosphatase [Actinomycetospora succinea]
MPATSTDQSTPDLVVPHHPSLANLRDVGGMPTIDGGRTRPGVLWRGDAPLEGDETQGPGGLAWPPGSVIDLRNPTELPAVHPLPALGAELTSLPLISSLAPAEQARGRAGELDAGELYLLLVQTIGEVWLPQLVGVAAYGPGPLFVHCAAGKDRTGVAVALLLRAAGVDRATVAADFAATNSHRAALRDRLVAQGAIDPSVEASRIGVTPEHIEPVLDLLDDDPRAPLRAAGVPDADVDAWRARLVEGA